MKLSDVLKEETWCTGAMALDKCGNLVESIDPAACKWCLAGALRKVCLGITARQQIVLFVYSLVPSCTMQSDTIVHFNDHNDWPAIAAIVEEVDKNYPDIEAL